MPVHRQTNRQRVSDAFIRNMLRERVRNRLPIDAKTIRDLDIACGSDRHSRLRREVLRELEREVAVAHEKPDSPLGASSVSMATAWGLGAAPKPTVTERGELGPVRRANAADRVRPMRRSGVAVTCGEMLRRLMGMVRRLARGGTERQLRAAGEARFREANR